MYIDIVLSQFVQTNYFVHVVNYLVYQLTNQSDSLVTSNSQHLLFIKKKEKHCTICSHNLLI